MGCQRNRKNVTNRTWEQLKHARYDYVYRNTIQRAWKYHLALGLTVEDIIFRKIIYDAMYDALPNQYGKIHWREFITEYQNFLDRYSSLLAQHSEKLQDWEQYRQSEPYKNFIEHLKDIKRTDWRLKASIDNALAYMHLKWGGDKNWGEKFQDLEKKLKLDYIEKIWSKKAVWFLVDALVFDASKLYASTEGQNEIKIKHFSPEEQAIKMYVKRWYERLDYVDEDFKLLAKIYEKIITTAVGEIGSVIIAEQMRRGAVLGLLHLAQSASKYVKTAKSLLGLASFLSGSVLAWLGWQILVEWAFDEEIQKALQFAFKYGFYLLTGDSTIWEENRLTKDELLNAMNIYFKLITTGKITETEKIELEIFKQLATTKQKEILWRILEQVNNARRLYNLKKSIYERKKEIWQKTDTVRDRIKDSLIEMDEAIENFDFNDVKLTMASLNDYIKNFVKSIASSKMTFMKRLKEDEEMRGEDTTWYISDNEILACMPWVGECDFYMVCKTFSHGRLHRYYFRDIGYSHIWTNVDEGITALEGYWDFFELKNDFKNENVNPFILAKLAKNYAVLRQDKLRAELLKMTDKLQIRIQRRCISIIRKKDFKNSRIREITKEFNLQQFSGKKYEVMGYIIIGTPYMSYCYYIETGTPQSGFIEYGFCDEIKRRYYTWKYHIIADRNGISACIDGRCYKAFWGNRTKRKRKKRSKIVCL